MITKSLPLAFALVLIGGSAFAETISHGGYPERVNGGGDKEPPACMLSAPDASTEPFLVKWNCVDNFTPSKDIRTELWLYRKNSQAGEMVGTFLGFPANVLIDQNILRTANIADALPVGFRLVARDTFGLQSVSPLIVVSATDTRLTSCTLRLTSAATTSLPAKSVVVTEATVTTTLSDENLLRIVTDEPATADPCDDIDDVCSDGDAVSFTADLTLDGEGNAEGTLSVSPGTVQNVEVEGSATMSDLELQSLSVEGETEVDSAVTGVSLSCEQ